MFWLINSLLAFKGTLTLALALSSVLYNKCYSQHYRLQRNGFDSKYMQVFSKQKLANILSKKFLKYYVKTNDLKKKNLSFLNSKDFINLTIVPNNLLL